LLFLEPEGLNTDEIYVNGMSTSLPAAVQLSVVRTIPGLEKAEIVRYGYAVEYDSVPSWQIDRYLETKPLRGMYLAGQILGTSGYEEAAAQGLMAGINAVRSLGGMEPMGLARDEAYIGVLLDDLVTKDISEPYRMFTSRAEHRLHLRCDNAEDRLLGAAKLAGILPAQDLAVLSARSGFVAELKRTLSGARVMVKEKNMRMPVTDYLRFPGINLAEIKRRGGAPTEFWDSLEAMKKTLAKEIGCGRLVEGAVTQVENDIKYEGYIAKHRRLLRNRDHLDNLAMPDELDYKSLTALSFEAREKLDRVRPATLGQASRIDGVRAGDLAVLTVFMKKWKTQAEEVAGE